MKKLIFAVLMVLATLILSSCATTSHLSVANSATISEANFHIVGSIEREYTATYFLGMGGSAKEQAVQQAISSMVKTLEPNQALAYINVVESNWVPILPIIVTQTTHISATIIQYDK